MKTWIVIVLLRIFETMLGFIGLFSWLTATLWILNFVKPENALEEFSCAVVSVILIPILVTVLTYIHNKLLTSKFGRAGHYCSPKCFYRTCQKKEPCPHSERMQCTNKYCQYKINKKGGSKNANT